MLRILAICLALLPSACGAHDERSTLDALLERGELVIGTEPEFPPFESKDSDGRFIGFDMDLARELARDLGVKLRIEEMAFDSLPSALATGKIDLILSGMTANAERAKSLSFTAPYFRTELCLLVGARSGIRRKEDVKGKRVVVKLGTTGAKQAPILFPKARITTLDTESACALQVVQGTADAFLYDRHSIVRHQRNHPRTTRAILTPLKEQPYAMAVKLGDKRFVERLNAFLRDVRADGRYARLYKKHLDAPR